MTAMSPRPQPGPPRDAPVALAGAGPGQGERGGDRAGCGCVGCERRAGEGATGADPLEAHPAGPPGTARAVASIGRGRTPSPASHRFEGAAS